MKKTFDIQFNETDGTVAALRYPDDPDGMNWVEGTAAFGMVQGAQVVSVEKTENGVHAVYETPHLRITVDRELRGDRYCERYRFEDRLDVDVFFNRGKVGIYTTFNDNYDRAGVCMTQKCHTHIWCGRNSSYIRAVKMGPFPVGLGLVLTEGSLDTYSIANREQTSNDRGDFVLHPAVFHLRPGENMTVEWELFWFADGHFFDAIEKYDSVLTVDAPQYTVFEGEEIAFFVNRPDVAVKLDGTAAPTETREGRTFVRYVPQRLGDHTFVLQYGDRETIAQFFVQNPFKTLARRRAEFIMNHQQFHRAGDSLDGAYLIYDNEDKCPVYDEIFSDYNACRERIGMGLFMAKYLQYDRDERLYESLMRLWRGSFSTRKRGRCITPSAKTPPASDCITHRGCRCSCSKCTT